MSGKDKGVQETPQQAAMVSRAMMQLDDYKQRWLPLQQRMAAQIGELGSETSAARQRARGRANVETQAKFGQAQGVVERSLTNAGKGPGTPGFGLAVTGLGTDLGAAKGAALSSADRAIDNAYIQGLSALTAIGRGEKANALQGESNIAAMSAKQAAADAAAATETRGANMAAAGTVIGYGASAYGAGKKPETPGVGAWGPQYTPEVNASYGGPKP